MGVAFWSQGFLPPQKATLFEVERKTTRWSPPLGSSRRRRRRSAVAGASGREGPPGCHAAAGGMAGADVAKWVGQNFFFLSFHVLGMFFFVFFFLFFGAL